MRIWVFISKKENRIELYGSVRSMFRNESISLKRILKRFKTGKKEEYEVTEEVTETILRNTLILHKDNFEDDNYLIKRLTVKRSTK